MSLQNTDYFRSRSNKLYGKAKATPTGRRRGPAAKSVGKPGAGNPHVRFDERGRETGRKPPRPSSTLLLGAGNVRATSSNPSSYLDVFSPIGA